MIQLFFFEEEPRRKKPAYVCLLCLKRNEWLVGHSITNPSKIRKFQNLTFRIIKSSYQRKLFSNILDYLNTRIFFRNWTSGSASNSCKTLDVNKKTSSTEKLFCKYKAVSNLALDTQLLLRKMFPQGRELYANGPVRKSRTFKVL